MSVNNSASEEDFGDSNMEVKSSSIFKQSKGNKNKQRANITARKYQKKIAERRKKVNNLLMKGCSQQEIMSKLHLSQPTASRDIAFLYNQTERNSLNIGKVAFEELHSSMSGTTELLKRAWNLLEITKSDRKLQLKIMEFITNCYHKRTELIQSAPMLLYLSLRTKRFLTIDRFLKKNNISIDEYTLKAILDTAKKEQETDNRKRIEEAKF